MTVPTHQMETPIQTEGAARSPDGVAEQLRELNELKTSFVALVSHELRTPVALVNGFLQVGLDELGPEVSPETREHFELASQNAARLTRIVQELTDFANLQRGAPTELDDPVPLQEAVRQVLSMLDKDMASKSIFPTTQLNPEVGALEFDGESLIVIFRNLLSNAAKSSPAGGKVWIVGRVAPGGERVEIAVNDTAVQIPPEKRDTIFQDFRQLENHLTRRYEGMGLGLAVARRTARVMGGDITLHVRNDGNTFLVTLPKE